MSDVLFLLEGRNNSLSDPYSSHHLAFSFCSSVESAKKKNASLWSLILVPPTIFHGLLRALR